MPLPPPPKELSRQRARDAKYTAKVQQKNKDRKAILMARIREMERERREQMEREERRWDNSPTITAGTITINDLSTGANITFY